MADEHCRSRMCRRRLSRFQSVNEFKVSEKPVQKTELDVKTLSVTYCFRQALFKKRICIVCIAWLY